MNECDTELVQFMARLRTTVRDADLREGDVEALLNLAPGMWRRVLVGQAVTLDGAQERRARLTAELVDRLSRRLERQGSIRAWLSEPVEALDGLSPIHWCAADVACLHAVVMRLRRGGS